MEGANLGYLFRAISMPEDSRASDKDQSRMGRWEKREDTGEGSTKEDEEKGITRKGSLDRSKGLADQKGVQGRNDKGRGSKREADTP